MPVVAKLDSAINVVRQTKSRERKRTIMEHKGLPMAQAFLQARASGGSVSSNASVTHATCRIEMPSVTKRAFSYSAQQRVVSLAR